MANITWFPYDVAAWEKRMRELGLSLEEEGVMMRLVRAGFLSAIPASILDNDEEFARILGAKWKRGVSLLRQHFTPDTLNPGRVRCIWLAEMMERAEQKHLSYVNRGKRGGRPPKTKADDEPELPFRKHELRESETSSSKNRSSASDPFARENKAEGFSCAPSEHTTKPPALDSALASEAARAPIAERPFEPRITMGDVAPLGDVLEAFSTDWRSQVARPLGPIS